MKELGSAPAELRAYNTCRIRDSIFYMKLQDGELILSEGKLGDTVYFTDIELGVTTRATLPIMVSICVFNEEIFVLVCDDTDSYQLSYAALLDPFCSGGNVRIWQLNIKPSPYKFSKVKAMVQCSPTGIFLVWWRRFSIFGLTIADGTVTPASYALSTAPVDPPRMLPLPLPDNSFLLIGSSSGSTRVTKITSTKGKYCDTPLAPLSNAVRSETTCVLVLDRFVIGACGVPEQMCRRYPLATALFIYDLHTQRTFDVPGFDIDPNVKSPFLTVADSNLYIVGGEGSPVVLSIPLDLIFESADSVDLRRDYTIEKEKMAELRGQLNVVLLSDSDSSVLGQPDDGTSSRVSGNLGRGGRQGRRNRYNEVESSSFTSSSSTGAPGDVSRGSSHSSATKEGRSQRTSTNEDSSRTGTRTPGSLKPPSGLVTPKSSKQHSWVEEGPEGDEDTFSKQQSGKSTSMPLRGAADARGPKKAAAVSSVLADSALTGTRPSMSTLESATGSQPSGSAGPREAKGRPQNAGRRRKGTQERAPFFFRGKEILSQEDDTRTAAGDPAAGGRSPRSRDITSCEESGEESNSLDSEQSQDRTAASLGVSAGGPGTDAKDFNEETPDGEGDVSSRLARLERLVADWMSQGKQIRALERELARKESTIKQLQRQLEMAQLKPHLQYLRGVQRRLELQVGSLQDLLDDVSTTVAGLAAEESRVE